MRVLGRLMRVAYFDFTLAQCRDVAMQREAPAVRQRNPMNVKVTPVTIPFMLMPLVFEEHRHKIFVFGLERVAGDRDLTGLKLPAQTVANIDYFGELIAREPIEFVAGGIQVQYLAVGGVKADAVRQVVQDGVQPFAFLGQRVAGLLQGLFLMLQLGDVAVQDQQAVVGQRQPVDLDVLPVPGHAHPLPRLAGMILRHDRADVFLKRR